ncbi:MAG: Cof-type HAD-IIB family hydrolase [Candidatus Poribacteria bacterium]|nr:Cof-type HAD-IIB family hydrolase [Candidatus Poribacteria bacterium]MDE0503850.1 Cof-type HAD-IIB family hydrolase [Candidatus Poribacteria bacterium]
MTRYKIIALDIDGTLLNSCGRVSDRTYKTIHRAAEEGAIILVVTGRRFFTAKQRMLQLDLPDMFLAVHNGAILKQFSGEVLYHRLLSRDMAQQVVEVAKEMGLSPVVFAGTDDEATVLVEDYWDKLDSWERGYLQENRRFLREVDNLSTDLPDDVIEVICVVPTTDLHKLAANFEERLNRQVKPIVVTTTDWQHAFIGLTSPDVSKREPLRFLAAKEKIDRGEIIAIGDNYNDLEMLQFAGVGVVMENAVPALKQMGFHVTASNNEDGVAQALQKFLFER